MIKHFTALFGLLLLLSPLFVTAQTQSFEPVDGFDRCSSMEYLEIQKAENPSIEDNMSEIERFTQEFIKNASPELKNAAYTIPVVVHVVYRTNAENISDAQVLSQIDVLNQDFRRTNSDANNTWSQAADSGIEFCMATVDPNGNPTNGINRVQTGKRSFRTNDDVKKTNKGGVNPWPTDQYLNMWVCNLANGILGYAQFPGGSSATDGVVMLYNAFGTADQNDGSFVLNATYNLGRTATHEVGHWLNLRHIWGDGGCSVDDYVSDTPTSDGANYGCASTHVSCSSLDMVQNYMDYSNDACMNLFTQGQKTRMHAVLAPGGFHHNLTNSTTCGGDGGGSGPATPTCTDGVQNGDETGVDCGGSCEPCAPTASCDDGVQNGNETGVDCGGSCSPCAPTGGTCDAPTGLNATPFGGGRKATLSWNASNGAVEYTVELRKAGAAWSSGTTTSTSIEATGLTKNATYEWRVKADCSDFSGIDTFVAAPGGRLDGSATMVSMYPNPASNFVVVEYNTDFESDVTVTVFDISGKEVSRSVNAVDAYVELNVSTLNNGVYFVKIQNGQDLNITEKVIINK